VASLEVDWEKVGLMELMVSWQIEVEDWEKMGGQQRLKGGMPKLRLWTSGHEPAATFVPYPF